MDALELTNRLRAEAMQDYLITIYYIANHLAMLCYYLWIFSICNSLAEQSDYSSFIQIVCVNILTLYCVYYIRQCSRFNNKHIVGDAGNISKYTVAIKYNDGVYRSLCTNALI